MKRALWGQVGGTGEPGGQRGSSAHLLIPCERNTWCPGSVEIQVCPLSSGACLHLRVLIIIPDSGVMTRLIQDFSFILVNKVSKLALAISYQKRNFSPSYYKSLSPTASLTELPTPLLLQRIHSSCSYFNQPLHLCRRPTCPPSSMQGQHSSHSRPCTVHPVPTIRTSTSTWRSNSHLQHTSSRFYVPL